MWPGVIDVKAQDDYKLILLFDNDERRSLDVKQFFSCGRFGELRDLNVFKQVHVSFDSIEWKNGLDLDPEPLYEKSERID
jgi:hypothetical protein